MSVTTITLTPHAVAVLGQLFVSGPVWDGNILSKVGRGVLFNLGLVDHDFGWTWLTESGVRLATEWSIDDLRCRNETQWLAKRRSS